MFDPQSINKNESNKKTLKETDFPVHYLEKDLEKTKKNPQYNPANFTNDREAQKKEAFKKSLSEKQKSSPFLKESPFQEKTVEKQPQKQPNLIINPQKEKKQQSKKEGKIQSQEVSSSKKGLFVLAGVVIIIAGFSLYYYTNIKKDIVGDKVEEKIAQEEEKEATDKKSEENKNSEIVENKEKENFSSEKPNFLILDENFQAKEILKQYAEKIDSEKNESLIEFIPVNNNYEPVELQTFFEEIKISAYPELISQNKDLDNFSLFMYKEKEGEIRLNLVIPISNSENLSKIIQQKEKILASDFKTLFFEKDTTGSEINFQSGSYKEINLNYYNFEDSGKLSFDYFFVDNKLVLATSKSSAFAIIDKFIK